MSDNKKYWNNRAKTYNSYERVTDLSYIDSMLKGIKFEKTDWVLDVGCGTGIMSDAISPMVEKVFCIDTSEAMIKCNIPKKNKITFIHDIRENLFADNIFDKIVARMVFHYITKFPITGFMKCYDSLKVGGQFIFSEAVPMKEELKDHFDEIFKHREPRLTFTSNEWETLLKSVGFNITRVEEYISELCLEDWVSDTTEEKAKKLLDLHLNASDEIKKAYNLREKDGKHYIDIKKVIIVGEK